MGYNYLFVAVFICYVRMKTDLIILAMFGAGRRNNKRQMREK